MYQRLKNDVIISTNIFTDFYYYYKNIAIIMIATKIKE